MAAERRQRSDDPAEAVARVSAAKREVLLRVHRHRLGFEDLEDCFSQAALELVTRARARERAFVSDAHIANALEQRFLSRISDRRRALSGRSPIQAATHAALRQPDDQEARHEGPSLATVPDPTADVASHLADRDDVGRLRELADELTADQRLVLACQVALDMDCQEFCARFGWSAENFRKVAQRARARLRVLVADYEAAKRCRGLADDLAAHVAGDEQSEWVRRHLSNCPSYAHTARERELERVARGARAAARPAHARPRCGAPRRALRARARPAVAVLGRGGGRRGSQGRRSGRGRGDGRPKRCGDCGRLACGLRCSQAQRSGAVCGRRNWRLRRLRPGWAVQRTAASRAPPHRHDRGRAPRPCAARLDRRGTEPRSDHPHHHARGGDGCAARIRVHYVVEALDLVRRPGHGRDVGGHVLDLVALARGSSAAWTSVRLARRDRQAVALVAQRVGEGEADPTGGSGDDGGANGHGQDLSDGS
jgi:DNA-directed RNA polymerase specialized sigma24 family protein